MQFRSTTYNIEMIEYLEMEGIILAVDTITRYDEKAYTLLKADADKILKLIKVQIDHLTMPRCPLYEEVLDTHMFGLSREIDFAVRLGMIDKAVGKEMLEELEQELSILHEASVNREQNNDQ